MNEWEWVGLGILYLLGAGVLARYAYQEAVKIGEVAKGDEDITAGTYALFSLAWPAWLVLVGLVYTLRVVMGVKK